MGCSFGLSNENFELNFEKILADWRKNKCGIEGCAARRNSSKFYSKLNKANGALLRHSNEKF